MEFEWDSSKAAANIRKHGVTFDKAATVFLDELAVSGADPDHSRGEALYITFGASSLGRLLTVSHTHALVRYASSVHGALRVLKGRSINSADEELRAEYKRSDFAKLERGKFFKEASKGTAVALIEPKLAKAGGDDYTTQRQAPLQDATVQELAAQIKARRGAADA